MDESESLLIKGEEENGDEFYEKIEAPKFVDLTAPDPYQPGDDRSWFCLRVGCEQNHEEEMDSETIYKNFVLRVMAARSPNVRLRKALCRKESGTDVKCPQTAPAKPSKSRVTRLALISSISKRIVDPKVKVKPLSKQKATPNAKAKQASAIAKALTTPRTRKQLANADGFRSVRNLKTTGTAVPDGKTVAKALVFHLPKKAATTKSSLELNTPIKTLCVEMKKLEITSGKKQFLGYNRSLPSDASRKQLRGREVKSRVFDGLCSQNHKIQDAKSSRCLKKNKRENKLQQNHAPVRHERVENDVNDLKIKEKTRNASQGVCSTSKSKEGNTPEGNLIATDISKSPLEDNKVEASLDSSGNDSNSLLNYDNVSQFPPPREIMERDDKRKTLNSGDKENDSEAMESDDKENASASDDNRELEVVMSHMKHKILGKHEISKTTKAKNKQSKESATTAAVGAQCLKLKKPKPTNPKPFRLRTNERGILKEANLEKKVHTTPLSEVTSVPKVAGGNSQKKQQNAPQRNEKCIQQNENHNDTCEKETMEDSQPQNSTYSFKNAKESVGRKLSFTPQRHTISSQQKLVVSQPERSQDKSTPKSMNSSRRTKSPFVRQLSRPQEAASRRKQIISAKKTGKLGTIKETCPTILRAKAAAKPSENGASLATKAYVSPASRRRFTTTTISKEPNFHAVHMPKSCTRRVA